MTSTRSSNPTRPSSPRQGRPRKDQPSRAQIRAMEARSVVVPVDPGQEIEAVLPVPATVQPSDPLLVSETETATRPRRARTRAAVRVVPLPRDVEYAYIRSDMRRLLAIAGVLLVLMVVPMLAIGF